MANIEKVNQVNQTDKFPYKVSANYLSNFMRKKDYLEIAIKNMAFIPRYYYEYLDYLDLNYNKENIKGIFVPMVCFCDIPLHQISIHAEGDSGYGKFGIALTKEWGEQNGLQPIHYVNPKSMFTQQFQLSLNSVLKEIEKIDIDSKLDELSDSLLEQLRFMKPNFGIMDKFSGEKIEKIKKNFHDEHEWRFVPNIDTDDAPDIIIDPTDQEYFLAEKNTKVFTESLRAIKKSYLKFSVEDIKYLFVETDKDRDNLITYIMKLRGNKLLKKDKYKMVSKIIVYSDLAEDL